MVVRFESIIASTKEYPELVNAPGLIIMPIEFLEFF